MLAALSLLWLHGPLLHMVATNTKLIPLLFSIMNSGGLIALPVFLFEGFCILANAILYINYAVAMFMSKVPLGS